MIKQPISDDDLKAQLRARAKDRLHNFILADGSIRGVVLHGTRMIREMRANHELGILETLLLGHAYLAAALMAAGLKGQDRLSLEIECAGPAKGLVVEANAFGEVCGYLRRVPIPVERPLQNFNLTPFLGAGFLTVRRYLTDAKQPFSGKVMLQYGSLAQDLANYYLRSEQLPSAFSLSIQFDRQGAVAGAGGLMLQVLPGVSEQVVVDLEQEIQILPSLGAAFAEERAPVSLVEAAFQNQNPRFIGQHRVEFMCHCRRQRLSRLLALLPADALGDIRANGPFPVELRCHYCNTRYLFDKKDIQQIYSQRFSNNYPTTGYPGQENNERYHRGRGPVQPAALPDPTQPRTSGGPDRVAGCGYHRIPGIVRQRVFFYLPGRGGPGGRTGRRHCLPVFRAVGRKTRCHGGGRFCRAVRFPPIQRLYRRRTPNTDPKGIPQDPSVLQRTALLRCRGQRLFCGAGSPPKVPPGSHDLL